jgi:serine/threonine-protein kinase HipA
MKQVALVYYKDLFAGTLEKTADDSIAFTYDVAYREEQNPPLSVSLPIAQRSFSSHELFPFFDGLIPEGWLLTLASEKWKLNPLKDRFELLLTTCFDCIGAVSIRASKDSPQANTSFDSSVLSPEELKEVRQEYLQKYTRCLSCYDPLLEHQVLYHPKCSQKLFGVKDPPLPQFSETSIRKLAEQSLSKGISIPGIQKKLSLDFVDSGKRERLTITDLWGRYIFKPRSHPPHLPENEHLITKLAESTHIPTEICGLIPLPGSFLAFIAKRFDRDDKFQKYHVEDFCQLLERQSYQKYNGSLEQVGRFITSYGELPGHNIVLLFQLIAFSFIVGNADLHLKNISLMHESPQSDLSGVLSPAYDLLSTDLYIPNDEQSALAINGKRNRLKRRDFDVLAERFGIPDKVKNKILKGFSARLPLWHDIIGKSYLEESKKIELERHIERRIKILLE